MKDWKRKGLLLLVLSAVLTGYWFWDGDKTVSPSPDSIGVNSLPLPDFTYRDQNGKPFGMEELKGKIWLADIIFTRCPDVCSPMTANMSRLQKKLAKSGLDVDIVSFSADPMYDTPPVLKRFGNNLRADFSNWRFLTHDSEPQMHQFLKTAFGVPIKRADPKNPDEPLVIRHSSRFYLIDDQGKVMAAYNGLQPDYAQVIRDIRSLQ
ncbi:SCO family protein [Salinithrix halophila]|uniref:SCO family protein n=2 Tax=Salinithrix halophila TaxID=1485204 RepID=A0ABV8JBM5_9BACL